MKNADNDNEPTSFGPITTDLSDLERIAAWLRVELIEDDVDHIALATDALLVRNLIEMINPTPRAKPVFTVVA